MIGDSTDAVWGVMDIYPRTDFPDIRKKATLHSNAGNLLLIPREGGSLVRFYIELPHGTVAKDVRLEDLHSAARQIFQPYKLDFADTFWWSAYSIGQRLADHFSKDNRVFLTGDACHTHSPKAGQGMNVSLQDGYNIGWKLAAVLKGQASPELFRTYNIEREKVAADLIDFDRSFTKLFSMKVDHTNGATPKYFSEQFIKSRQYTAGLTARYDDSIITSAEHSKQELAENLKIGMRFPSSQVVRFCDAKEMQFAKALSADGRWRIVVFAGDLNNPVGTERLGKVKQPFLDISQLND
jgi:phenol 2-monooxygenase